MNREENISRFEIELMSVSRDGMDRLLNFIRKSDFYTAPASTRFHLSCEGGLLQHSLNVLDALRGMLISDDEGNLRYQVAGKTVATVTDDSVILMALLHDVCKTYYYVPGSRNVKNEQTGDWEKVPTYTVNDRMPLGHGSKSAMIIKQYIDLTSEELYAIWWHMGFSGNDDKQSLSQAIGMYPIVWALHTADMMATSFMESERGNKSAFDVDASAEN